MIYEFLNNQTSVSADDINTVESNIRFKLEFIERLFFSSIKDWPSEQKNTMKFQIDSGDSVSPVARAFPGGLYRVIFPVKMVYELESIVFGKEVISHDKSSQKTRIILIALMLCLYHELLHCLRGHLDEDLNSSKSEETDADFIAGGALWGCIKNQYSILSPYGFGDSKKTAYEMGYASTVLCVLFQKYHKAGDGYHLPHQRLLTLTAGYIRPIFHTQGCFSAKKIGELQEKGINDAKLFIKASTSSIYCTQLFDNENNREDYLELISDTKNKRDQDIGAWHKMSFLLEPIKKLLSKN